MKYWVDTIFEYCISVFIIAICNSHCIWYLRHNVCWHNSITFGYPRRTLNTKQQRFTICCVSSQIGLLNAQECHTFRRAMKRTLEWKYIGKSIKGSAILNFVNCFLLALCYNKMPSKVIGRKYDMRNTNWKVI